MSIFPRRRTKPLTDDEFEDYEERPSIREWLHDWSDSLSAGGSNGLIDAFSAWIEESKFRFWIVAFLIILFLVIFWAVVTLIFGSPFHVGASTFESALVQMNHSSPGGVNA